VGERRGLRVIRAANPSPLTLDGTRTHIVGRERVAIIDPGPDLPAHIDAVAEAIGGGVSVSILLTHDHPDHAAGADALARRLGTRALRFGDGIDDGQRFDTDAGELIAVATPGHTPDHVAFDWPAGRAVFVGDLMLGGMDTALIAPPEGDLAAYLASLDRVRRIGAQALIPAHGDPFEDADAAIGRYVAHRRQRLARVREAIVAAGDDGARADEVTTHVYGGALAADLRVAAEAATHAYLDWLVARGEARLEGGRWRV